MSKPEKTRLFEFTFFRMMVGAVVLSLVIFLTFFLCNKIDKNGEKGKQKLALSSSAFPAKNELSAEDESTAGNWTFIKFRYKVNFHGIFDTSTIPEILDEFENKHPNLSIRDYPEIVYNPNSSSPQGILIRHDLKLK